MNLSIFGSNINTMSQLIINTQNILNSQKIKKKIQNYRLYTSSTFLLLLCPHRYRFVELYYRRSKVKGRTFPTRVETVVIYLPDVRSCVPTRIEWDALHASYKTKMEFVIKQESEGRLISTDNSGNSGGGGGGDDTSLAVAKSQVNAAADGDVKKNSGEEVSENINKSSQQEKSLADEDETSKVDSNEGASATAAVSSPAAATPLIEKAQQFLFLFLRIFYFFIFKTKFIFR